MNRAATKETVPSANSASVKLTTPPENSVARKLTQSPTNRAPEKETVLPLVNTAWKKSPPSKTTPVQCQLVCFR